MEGCLKKPPCSGKRAAHAALVILDGAEPNVLLYLKISDVVPTSKLRLSNPILILLRRKEPGTHMVWLEGNHLRQSAYPP